MGLSPNDLTLLADSQLVAAYATRAGRLQDTSLLDAITAAKTVNEDDSVAVQKVFASLAAALSRSVASIAPMTLVDLRAGRSPFDDRQANSLRINQSVLGVLALIFLALVAHYSVRLRQEGSALAALQKALDSHVVDKLNSVRRMAEMGKVFTGGGADYDAWHRQVRELRELSAEFNSATSSASELLAPPRWTGVFHALSSRDIPGAAPPAKKPAQAGVLSTEASSSPAIDSSSEYFGAASAKADTNSDAHSRCARTQNVASQPSSSSTELNYLEDVLADVVQDFCFAFQLQLPSVSPYGNDVPFSTMYTLADEISSLRDWYLPTLYGLLGAVVFLMRSQLDTRTPNLETVSTVLRIVLGGVAGLAIGWVISSPEKPGPGSLGTGSISLGLSFLAGYSVDILFSALDRMRQNLSDGAASKPGSPFTGAGTCP